MHIRNTQSLSPENQTNRQNGPTSFVPLFGKQRAAGEQISRLETSEASCANGGAYDATLEFLQRLAYVALEHERVRPTHFECRQEVLQRREEGTEIGP